ncbi:hypothetical protein H4R35_005797 [Dimargaris xerosporica]|nr:hypothetical protein H4R35_005797 [Dimargaris xerosporica]
MSKHSQCIDTWAEAAAVAAEFGTLCQRFNIASGNSSPDPTHSSTPQLPSIAQLSNTLLGSSVAHSNFEPGPPCMPTIPYCRRCGKLQYYSRIRGHLPPRRYIPVQRQHSSLSLEPSGMLDAFTACIVYRAHRHRKQWPSHFEPWLDLDALWHHHPSRSAEPKRARRDSRPVSKPFLQRNIQAFSDA